MNNIFQMIRDKMLAAGMAEKAIASFLATVDRVHRGQRGLLPERVISPVRSLLRLEEIPTGNRHRLDLLDRLAIVKLNGGLGTSMGLRRAKSLLNLRRDDCFLDFIVREILHMRKLSGSRMPAFYLMDSFSTHEETVRYLRKFSADDLDEGACFVQSTVPKIDATTLAPISWPDNPDLEWCPPGHGDLYTSMQASGVLETMFRNGVRYLFVSNSDNLGASVDPSILAYFAESGLSFLMEVAERTSSDTKGGHLAQGIASEQLLLRELAQCPSEDLAAFQDIDRHHFFNTNNLWIRLDDLKDELGRHNGLLALPLIANRKTVDPRDSNSPKVIQLESAAGAAIECFERSDAIVVPRSRFAPVKTTSDLLAVRSNAYRETSDGCLILDESRQGKRPIIDLDQNVYKHIDAFETAFPAGVPSLIHCDSLRISGRWVFSAEVVCEGNVEFSNPFDDVLVVTPGTYRGKCKS